MKNTLILTALALATSLAHAGAGAYTFTTDAYSNSTANPGGGSHATGGALTLTIGEVFTVSTDASQIWHAAQLGDDNYNYFTSNADGAPGNYAAPYLNGAGLVNVGTLVADINGVYRVIGAGTHSFTSWGAGELMFHFTDANYYDNSGAILSTVTAVPEPESYAMLLAGLGLIGGIARRCKNKNSTA